METLKEELNLIGLPSDKPFGLKDVKRSFRKRSLALLPEKSLGNQNAHCRFEELNTAFIKIIKQMEKNDEDIADILPGEVNVSKVQMVMKLRQGSVPVWKKLIKLTYPTVIVGAQKKSNYIPEATGKAIRFVIYWKTGSAGVEGSGQLVKVNLILYENDLLQVAGSGFLIWPMECFQEMRKQVNNSEEGSKDENEDSFENKEENSYSSSQESQIETLEESIEEVKICEGEERFNSILQHLQSVKSRFNNNCEEITDKVKNIESDCNKQLRNAFKRVNSLEKESAAQNAKLQEILDGMNKKVSDTRQIAGAYNMSHGKAPSKVKTDSDTDQMFDISVLFQAFVDSGVSQWKVKQQTRRKNMNNQNKEEDNNNKEED